MSTAPRGESVHPPVTACSCSTALLRKKFVDGWSIVITKQAKQCFINSLIKVKFVCFVSWIPTKLQNTQIWHTENIIFAKYIILQVEIFYFQNILLPLSWDCFIANKNTEVKICISAFTQRITNTAGNDPSTKMFFLITIINYWRLMY